MKIEILKTYSEDILKKFVKIENQCFKSNDAFSEEEYIQLLNDQHSTILIAEEGSDVAGFIVGSIYGKEGHIITLDVSPNYRGKGIGRILLNKIEQRFRNRNVKVIHLEVRISNDVAQSLYLSSGYKIVGKLEEYYPDEHGLYCQKVL